MRHTTQPDRRRGPHRLTSLASGAALAAVALMIASRPGPAPRPTALALFSFAVAARRGAL